MTPDAFAGGKERPVVALRSQQDYVKFWHEQENPGNSSTQSDAHAHRDDLGIASEIDRNKSDPNDARGVHGESDKFGFVEVLRNVSRLQSVQSAQDDEEEIES